MDKIIISCYCLLYMYKYKQQLPTLRVIWFRVHLGISLFGGLLNLVSHSDFFRKPLCDYSASKEKSTSTESAAAIIVKIKHLVDRL